MSEDAWVTLVHEAYESWVEQTLRGESVFAKFAREAREEHDAWWAKQTRWFKVKYRIRTRFVKHRDNLRYRIANAIYPYPQDDEWRTATWTRTATSASTSRW